MKFQSSKEMEKIRKVQSFVKNMGEKSIESYIESSDWKDKKIALDVVKNNPTEEDKKYLSSILTNSHVLDNRSPEQYALNVALSWVIEDLIVSRLNSDKIDVEFAGTDKNRTFDYFSSNSPDIYFKKKNKYFEIITNYYYGFKSSKTIALRDNKYENLIMFNSGILLYDFSTNFFYIVDNVSKEKPISEETNKYFGKKVITIKIDSAPLTYNMLVKKLSVFS